jgi:serine/threonine-protein kinase
MELLGGESLSEALVRGGPMSAGRVARIAHQCAQALAAAHAAGIVHRDLKPGNIRLLSSRRGDIVKILDFGVAKILGSSRRTKVGTVFGTPHYMSPEQGRGHEIDHRTDIYSLGVIMYQCLTGRVPFEADTYMGIVTKHLFARPEPIAVGDGEPAEHRIEPVVMRCLEKDAANRYAIMDDLAHDLEAVLAGEPSGAERDLRGGGRLRLREQERVLAPARPEAIEPVPLVRTSAVWVAGGLALAIVAGLAWWRPWQRAAEPVAADGGVVTLSSATPTVGPAVAPIALDTATAPGVLEAPPPPSGETTAAATAGRRRATPSDGASSKADPTASATATASVDAAPTAPPPPRPKGAGTRHGGDVVDPWGH